MNIWHILLEQLNICELEIFQVRKSSVKNSVSLEDSLPFSMIESRTPLLFLADSYMDIINNYRIFHFRNTSNDAILDLNGNQINIHDYYHTLGSK